MLADINYSSLSANIHNPFIILMTQIAVTRVENSVKSFQGPVVQSIVT